MRVVRVIVRNLFHQQAVSFFRHRISYLVAGKLFYSTLKELQAVFFLRLKYYKSFTDH